MDGYPGLYRDLLTYLRERIKEVLTGSSATLVIRVYGENLDVLREKAQDVKDSISNIEGVIDLKVKPQILVPQIEVHVRPEIAAQFGLNAGLIRSAVNLYLKGLKVGEFYEDQKIFDIVVMGEKSIRLNIDTLKSIMIDTPASSQVPLKEWLMFI